MKCYVSEKEFFLILSTKSQIFCQGHKLVTLLYYYIIGRDFISYFCFIMCISVLF